MSSPTDASVQEDYRLAWAPTFSDFAELICLAQEGELSFSHTAFGCWSFWRPGGRLHAVIDASMEPPYPLSLGEVHRARFYLREPLGDGARWADRHSVLDALNISDWLDSPVEDLP